MGRRWDCSCVGLTVDYRDLPGAAAHTAEAPIAPTQGGVGKLPTAAATSAITTFDRGNRARTIEHGFDGSLRTGYAQLLLGVVPVGCFEARNSEDPCSGRSECERFVAVGLWSYARGVSRVMDALLREGDPSSVGLIWTLGGSQPEHAFPAPDGYRIRRDSGGHAGGHAGDTFRGRFRTAPTTFTRTRGCTATMSPCLGHRRHCHRIIPASSFATPCSWQETYRWKD